MILGRRAPACARVVDEDVDVAEALDRFSDQRLRAIGRAEIRGDRARFDAELLQMLDRLVEFVLLACRKNQLRALLAQRFGDLQPESARASGDECGAAGEVEEFLDAPEGALD